MVGNALFYVNRKTLLLAWFTGKNKENVFRADVLGKLGTLKFIYSYNARVYGANNDFFHYYSAYL